MQSFQDEFSGKYWLGRKSVSLFSTSLHHLAQHSGNGESYCTAAARLLWLVMRLLLRSDLGAACVCRVRRTKILAASRWGWCSLRKLHCMMIEELVYQFLKKLHLKRNVAIKRTWSGLYLNVPGSLQFLKRDCNCRMVKHSTHIQTKYSCNSIRQWTMKLICAAYNFYQKRLCTCARFFCTCARFFCSSALARFFCTCSSGRDCDSLPAKASRDHEGIQFCHPFQIHKFWVFLCITDTVLEKG